MATHDIHDLPLLPPRQLDSHKGDFGRVLVVAGSRGMSGAAILCGSAALRAGAGLVKVAVPLEILPIVALGNPCYMTVALPGEVAEVRALCDSQDVVAVGPGIGQSAEATALLMELVERIAKPMVIDADGLNAFVGHVDKLRSNGSPRIITPHPGEFARLLHTDTKTVQAQRQALAIEFAR